MNVTVNTVTFTAKEKAELVSTDLPLDLGPTEVAGTTLATLVSPGTELNGSYIGERFPRTPGYSAIFEVEHIGSEVEGVSKGDRLYCMGRHESFQKFDVKNTLPVPDGLAPEVAVYARLMGVTMTTLCTTIARPPEMVVVTGLGPVGNLGAQNFNACGYTVIGVDPDAERRELMTRLGIRRVLDAVPLGDPEFQDRVTMVLDCSGHEQAIVDGARLVRKHGEVVCVGAPWARRNDASAHDLHHPIFFRYVVVRSGWEWRLPHHPEPHQPHSIFGNFATALQWLRDGKVRTEGLGSRSAPADCQDVYQSLLRKTAECPTVVFDWSS